MPHCHRLPGFGVHNLYLYYHCPLRQTVIEEAQAQTSKGNGNDVHFCSAAREELQLYETAQSGAQWCPGDAKG